MDMEDKLFGECWPLVRLSVMLWQGINLESEGVLDCWGDLALSLSGEVWLDLGGGNWLIADSFA